MPARSFTPFPILTTERLVLRQPRMNEDIGFFKLRSDVEVNKYLDRAPCTSISDARDFIIKVNENTAKDLSLYWTIALKDNDALIGTICLFGFTEDGLCEIGYELLPEYQGRGLMKEAAEAVINYTFSQLQVTTIDAFLHKDNQPSIKLLERLSFTPSGVAIADEPQLVGYRLIH